MRRGVAPRAGAWIETDHAKTYLAMAGKSRPVRARGLKRGPYEHGPYPWPSRPVRARGLKHCQGANPTRHAVVAPRAGAWIETTRRPTATSILTGRAPCGRVD